jgi:predicted transposase YbfD/YdcC
LTLGQVAVDTKCSEITAIPKLLRMLELSGAIVSIDAMGCQKEIARQIIHGGGDYVLAVKDNQPKLLEGMHEFFTERHLQDDFADHSCRQHTTTERSRGRNEERSFVIAPLPDSMKHPVREWKGLKSIGQVTTRHPLDSPHLPA